MTWSNLFNNDHIIRLELAMLCRKKEIKCADAKNRSYSCTLMDDRQSGWQRWPNDDGNNNILYLTALILHFKGAPNYSSNNQPYEHRHRLAECNTSTSYFDHSYNSTALQLIRGRGLLTDFSSHVYLSQTDVNDHPASLGVIWGQHVEFPAVYFLSRPGLPIKITSYLNII